MPVNRYYVIFLFICCFCSISSAQEATKSILATGTAFSVTKNGFLLTSAHIINEKDKIEVTIPGKSLSIPAKLIALDRAADLALLKINESTIPLPINEWTNVSSGLDIVTLGFPNPQALGDSLKITSGIINSIESNKSSPFLFQFSAQIHPGNSGGPVLSLSGDVVGIVHGYLSDNRATQLTQNVNYAINSLRIINFLTKEKIDYLRASTSSNLRPQEIFSKYEGSVFLVKASGSKDLSQKNSPELISADIDNKIITGEGVPEKLRLLLKSLPEREKPKIFGAYKAGYDLILENTDSFILIKSDSVKINHNFDVFVVEFDSIISFKSERFISNDSIYNSILMNAFLKCDTVEVNIRRQEFKPDVFGIGKTLIAKRLQNDSYLKWSQIKSSTTKNFLHNSLCKKKL
jgi:hypothetical protein